MRDDVEVICRWCDYHMDGPVATSFVRWEECWKCRAQPKWDWTFRQHLDVFLRGLRVWWCYRKWRGMPL